MVCVRDDLQGYLTTPPGTDVILEHPYTVPADGAVGVEVEGHQAFWTCDRRPFILVLTTVSPHTDSLGVSTKTKAGLFSPGPPNLLATLEGYNAARPPFCFIGRSRWSEAIQVPIQSLEKPCSSPVASEWKQKVGVSNKVASEWKQKVGVSNKVASEWKQKVGVSNKVASEWKQKVGVSNKVASEWKQKVGVSNKVASEWKQKVGVSNKVAITSEYMWSAAARLLLEALQEWNQSNMRR
ncbi:hypothetical protein NFI96_006763 [Prochilodus magdalenae]|nr:hypothetical protein NFI96_006763 [Prochilodus magdalenae]